MVEYETVSGYSSCRFNVFYFDAKGAPNKIPVNKVECKDSYIVLYGTHVPNSRTLGHTIPDKGIILIEMLHKTDKLARRIHSTYKAKHWFPFSLAADKDGLSSESVWLNNIEYISIEDCKI